jgi:hypothetical protein
VANKGEERWGQLLTFTAAGRNSIIKQTTVRTGPTLVVVSGSPNLVDTHLNKALHKAIAHGPPSTSLKDPAAQKTSWCVRRRSGGPAFTPAPGCGQGCGPPEQVVSELVEFGDEVGER